MIETCYECGTSWGVTMKPRDKVLCTPCARPQPWKWPVWYWKARIWTLPWSGAWVRSPEWWDNQTTLADLRAAVASAEKIWGDGDGPPLRP